nr:ribonuclease H-like domain-containing protein [Tanacetum cinerariifolium]
PQPVPTGKPKVFALVPAGRKLGLFQFLLIEDILHQQLLLSPQQVVLGNHIEKENPFSDVEDEEIFDSGCSRSMTDTECLVLSKDFKLPDESMMVKAIRCDNGSEFKNALMIKLSGSKGIKREYSNARTPQQNGVAERKNRTLIEAARIMLADSKLPTMFWTEAVRTACYVLNRVSVTRPPNKTPYALLTRNIPSVSHFKPFGCHVTILNTSDHLGKFDGKADEGYIVGYSASNKAYRYNHVQASQSAGKQGATTNPVGTQDADSDSDCDEQVIIFPSYPSHSIQGTQPGDEVDDSLLNSAAKNFQKELARLKDQEHKGTLNAEGLGLGCANDAEELQKHASAKTVPPGCIPVPTGNVLVPPGSLPVPTGSILVSAGNTVVSTDNVPGHTSSSTDLFITNDPTMRFPSPSDLRNYDPWK